MGKILLFLKFGSVLASVLCMREMSIYKRLTHSEKLNSVIWRYLKQIPESSVLRCGGQCLKMGSDCQAFAISRQKYDCCVLLGGFPQLNHKVWMDPDGSWSVYHVLSGKCPWKYFCLLESKWPNYKVKLYVARGYCVPVRNQQGGLWLRG